MQAVILAAGLGTRMRPLTDMLAKPLLKVCGRPLLDYTFKALPDAISEVIVVIGYLGDQIKAYLGENFQGKAIRYVEQKALLGTANALFEAKSLLKARFLVFMADDIYAREDIEKCLEYEQAIMVKRIDSAGPGGKVELNEKGRLQNVVEGKNHQAGSFISIGVYLLTAKIFDYEPVKLLDREGEWGLPQTVAKMAHDIPVSVVEATRWIKITTPDDLLRAADVLFV